MRYRYQSGDKIYEVIIERSGDVFQATVDGSTYAFEILDTQPGSVSLHFEGQPQVVYWAAEGGEKWLSLHGCTYRLEKPSPHAMRRPGERAAEDVLRAPMPAQVRSVAVSAEEVVEKGQTLLLLEAMKMEIRLQAPRRGRVRRLLVEAGQTVNRDQELVEIEDV